MTEYYIVDNLTLEIKQQLDATHVNQRGILCRTINSDKHGAYENYITSDFFYSKQDAENYVDLKTQEAKNKLIKHIKKLQFDLERFDSKSILDDELCRYFNVHRSYLK